MWCLRVQCFEMGMLRMVMLGDGCVFRPPEGYYSFGSVRVMMEMITLDVRDRVF